MIISKVGYPRCFITFRNEIDLHIETGLIWVDYLKFFFLLLFFLSISLWIDLLSTHSVLIFWQARVSILAIVVSILLQVCHWNYIDEHGAICHLIYEE